MWMGDRGCGYLISLRVCRSGTIALEVMKSPANSASEDEDMTTLIIWTRERIGPLSWGNRVIVRAEGTRPRTAVGASFIEVCRVGVCSYKNVAGSVSDAIIRIGDKLFQ